MAEPMEELSKKLENLSDTFSGMLKQVGKQVKEIQDIVTKNIADVKELKKEVKAQGIRVKRLEGDREQDRFRYNMVEDRMRRANIRIRGLPQDFAGGKDLLDAIWNWFEKIGIEIDNKEIERVHWIAGPRRGPQRDIIVKFLSERLAENIFKQLKKITNLNWKGSPIRVLKDLSVSTLQARSKMRPVADALFQKGIKFSWQFPANIVVFQDGRMLRARSVEEGNQLLADLGFNVDLQDQSQASEEEISGAVGGEDEQFEKEIEETRKKLADLQDKKRAEEKRLARQQKAKMAFVLEEEGTLVTEDSRETRVTRQREKKK